MLKKPRIWCSGACKGAGEESCINAVIGHSSETIRKLDTNKMQINPWHV
jgi:hypothetical protein